MIIGARCLTWDGYRGVVVYVTADGWFGVRVDGETTISEFQAWQVIL